ncbi:hypothetical protein AGABI1DRAFT_53852 [Agaricus bisporus var. burnettii JB137-S8]|uniref:Methyltransferase domain-containing protein n=1 Tax=Agaricus bisporus var. burnettii (strain JB137-S8 / ATCC MYA-4627 / FGSC 10392) TaxID=597362 RepID=K5Y506_AGABU|nr:uncharacterized protein AGABI1DRAFT_53852 [Agaricus bisporus var. burnettii JB137-S8]EKM83130.1 hypothetical protein AGABI1DRAFT_53852 [Agaricus bisporus var. burnettii JB137-S8]
MSDIRNTVTRTSNYTKADGTVDILAHDTEERLRLELQHGIFLRAFDSKVLHAPVKLNDDDWILDVGTGTGIWLQDLGKEVSTKPQFLGVDINSSFFPQPSTLPKNISFETQSVLDLPEEWTDKFTLIHQRLLISSFRKHEWEQALREIYRTLKPGGWVQLFELRTWTSGPALAKQLDLFYRFSDDIGMMHRDITIRLPDFLKQSDFVNVHEDTRGSPLGAWANQDGIDGKNNLMGVLRFLRAPVLRGGGYGIIESEAEYDELVEEISKELDMTPGSEAVWTMFWAQKPVQ